MMPNATTQYGGPFSTLAGMLEIWSRNGQSADLACCRYSQSIKPLFSRGRVYRFSASFPERLSRSAQFESWFSLCVFDYDVIFIHGVWTVMATRAAQISWGANRRFVLVPHGSLDPYDLRKKRWAKKFFGMVLIRQMLSRASVVLCATDLEAKRLESYGASRSNIEVISWPVRNQLAGNRQTFREVHKIKSDAFVCLFLSRLDSKKGLLRLIEAFGLVEHDVLPILVVAGDGSKDFVIEAKRLVELKNLSARVHFVGFLEGNLRSDAYAAADLYLLPSENENFGHSVVEALGAGVPVVITPEVYISDFVENSRSGWVSSLNPRELGERIQDLIQNRDLLTTMRARCRAAAENFLPEKLESRYLDLLGRLAEVPISWGSGAHSLPEDIDSKLSITHVQGLFSPEHGGPAYSLANFCLEQARLGHKVSVRTLDGYRNVSPARTLPAEIDLRVSQVGWPEKLGYSRGAFGMLKKDSSPDVYHIHGSWLLLLVFAARQAKLRKRPYIVEMMGSCTRYELRRKWVRKSLARFLYQDRILREAACIHVNSLEEGRMLREIGLNVPIACLPVGVDLAAIRNMLSRIEENISGRSRPFLLYLGRIHPTKGIESLLSAWRIVHRDRPEFELIIAGAGEPSYEARCRRECDDLVKKGSVVWLGKVSEMEKVRLYRDAKLYVLPSLNENFGNTVAEAFACGTPVLTTVNTQWTMIEERSCGWLAEATVHSLHKSLTRFFEAGPDEWSRRGRLGKEMVDREYSIESVVGRMLRLYRGVIDESIPADLLM